MRNPPRSLAALFVGVAVFGFLLIGPSPAGHAATVAQAIAQIAPPAPGLARVWVLRQWDPVNMIGLPMVYANGVAIAPSEAGTAYYRDLPAGRYVFTIESCGRDVYQGQQVDLAANTQTNLEIQILRANVPPDCEPQATFYVRQIPPNWATMYFNQLSFLGPR